MPEEGEHWLDVNEWMRRTMKWLRGCSEERIFNGRHTRKNHGKGGHVFFSELNPTLDFLPEGVSFFFFWSTDIKTPGIVT